MSQEWPEPTEPTPNIDELWLMMDEGVFETTDGCVVEMDGVCQHGHPSWVLKLGFV